MTILVDMENIKPELVNNRPGRPPGGKQIRFKPDMVREGIDLLLDLHYSQSEFIRHFYVNHNLTKQEAKKYWNKGWQIINAKFELEKESMVSKHLVKYWDIHDAAISKGDMNTARQALNDIAKLVGLNEPEKHTVSHNVIKLNFGVATTTPIQGEENKPELLLG
jgi:hypothetical protein